MKALLAGVFLLISLSLTGTTYYVATNGSDNNPGTISEPFATWQKGFDIAKAGDLVYIRGGIYTVYGSSFHAGYVGVVVDNKSGTDDNPIMITAYPGEIPILDCENITGPSTRVGICFYKSSYWHLKGLQITNATQYQGGGYLSIGVLTECSNNITLELLSISRIGGPGIRIATDSEDILVLNCDSFYNYDPYSDPQGDNADGFNTGEISERLGNERKITFIGCRAWDNSDDGFDFIFCAGITILDKCWAWHNGVIPGTNTLVGNSNGFKLGGGFGTSSKTDYLRIVTNCLSYNHRQIGFTQQGGDCNMLLYNNTAYLNDNQGYEFGTHARADILRNNISYRNGKDVFQSSQTQDHNSWDSNVNLNDADFTGFNDNQLVNPRNEDGSLPDIDFLHLANGSDLIDAGIDVGFDFNGDAPDLGAFETGSGQTIPPVPECTSTVVENATPSVLEMTYNLTLANIVPDASAFSVQVNSSARDITSVSVSGTKVLLTLASPVAYDNTVTVSYAVPSANPLQTPSGGKAEAINAQSVTNQVSAPVNPVYVSSAIENSAPSVIEMTYNLTLATTVPATSAFSVQVNSVARSVTSVTVSGAKVLLTLGSPVAYGNVVTVSYTVPSSNPLQTTAGVKAASISAKSVTNNTNPPTSPVYVSSAVENATPSVIAMTYNLSLANIVPATSAFSVNVNSAARNVSSVAISGTKVLLTLASPVVNGNRVTVAYTKPSTYPLQTSSGGQAATISAQTVTNKVNAVSQPVVVVTPPAVVNTPPVVVVNNISGTYSGFVGTLNASGSYDVNKDNLTYAWKIPGNIPVSATNGPIIEFLAPFVEANQTFEFALTVSDGKNPQTKTVSVTIIPYEPELEKADVISVEAASYQSPYNPSNILDGNVGTMWSVNGNDQWIVLELDGTYSIQHIELAFQPGQKKEFYFDIYGSNDKENWEPVLSKSRSCAFSGNLQVFDFPSSKTEREFRYVKLVGQGNSTDTWNYVAEFRIFGNRHKNPVDYEEQIVKIYPNPAHELVNILIDESTFMPDFIKIVSLTGKIFFDSKVDPEIKQFQIPIDFKQGIYIVQMGIGSLTVFTQKLIVTN
jgi:uncharacterized repeat protein (TIGR02059 family)